MKIEELLKKYALLPQVGALANTLGKKSVKTVFLEGLMCSSAPMLFASLSQTLSQRKGKASAAESPLFLEGARGRLLLFILQDADEAGYFYHDLTQLLGKEQVRTEVLARLSLSTNSSLSSEGGVDAGESPLSLEGARGRLLIVTYPEAIAELVVSKKQLDDRSVVLSVGDVIDADQTAQQLRSLGFQEVDYVYEPGQFALRGSILDVYSYSSELPFRISCLKTSVSR